MIILIVILTLTKLMAAFVQCCFVVCVYRLDFVLTESDDRNSLLLDLAVYRYCRLVKF